MLKDPKRPADIFAYIKSTPQYKNQLEVDYSNYEKAHLDTMQQFLLGETIKGNIKDQNTIWSDIVKFHMVEGIKDDKKLKLRIFNETKAYQTFKKWEEYKQVYSINPAFFSELVSTESTKFNSVLLNNFPFPAFYLDLTKVGLKYSTYNEMQELYGMFVVMQEDYKEDCHCIMIDLVFNNRTFQHLDFLIQKNSDIMLRSKDDFNTTTNVEDIYEFWSLVESMMYPGITESMSEIFITVMNLLLYMCSTTPDITSYIEPTRKTSKNNKIKVVALVQQWKIGYHIGPKLYEARKKYEESLHNSTGSTVLPHIRKAHWHMYWCGPKGNQHIELRWLEPIFVNCDNAEKLPVVEREGNIEDKEVVI